MSNNYFRFKQFTIRQENCAMKVGTDGCLLGGWFDCSQSKRILDAGCGSGLIALMAAQRCDAEITGVEIDADTAVQAAENAAESPWGGRINIVNADVLQFAADVPFDSIVCNPPYFVNSLKCGSESRTKARHSDTLDCEAFFKKAKELLALDGKVSIVIPGDMVERWKDAAAINGFSASRIIYIKTTPRKMPKRALLEFVRAYNANARISTIVLEDKPGLYSEDAKRILGDFYLYIM